MQPTDSAETEQGEGWGRGGEGEGRHPPGRAERLPGAPRSASRFSAPPHGGCSCPRPVALGLNLDMGKVSGSLSVTRPASQPAGGGALRGAPHPQGSLAWALPAPGGRAVKRRAR